MKRNVRATDLIVLLAVLGVVGAIVYWQSRPAPPPPPPPVAPIVWHAASPTEVKSAAIFVRDDLERIRQGKQDFAGPLLTLALATLHAPRPPFESASCGRVQANAADNIVSVDVVVTASDKHKYAVTYYLYQDKFGFRVNGVAATS
jgi:hypothetical protein